MNKNSIAAACTMLLTTTAFSSAKYGPTVCKLDYGEAVFQKITLTLEVSDCDNCSTERNANRPVQVHTTYVRSDYEAQVQFPKILEGQSTVIDVVNLNLSLRFGDLHDFSGGTFHFFRSSEGNYAVLQYASDSEDAFGVFKCEEFPRLTW